MNTFTPNTTVRCIGFNDPIHDEGEFIVCGEPLDQAKSEIPVISGALKFDEGKMNPLLLEQDLANPLMVVNAVLQYGVNKYGARGGWKGVDAERYEAALARHRRAHLRGEQLDPESGLPHWAHAVCNELFLAYFQMDGMTSAEVDAMATPNAPPGAGEPK